MVRLSPSYIPQLDIEPLTRAVRMQRMQLKEIYTAISDTIADVESRANTLSSILGRSYDPARFLNLWGAVDVMALILNQTDRLQAITVQTLISIEETMAKVVINTL